MNQSNPEIYTDRHTLSLHDALPIYSGPIGLLTVVQITLIYSLASALGGYLFAQAPQLDLLFAVGAALFLLGEIGNFAHHKILADLREQQTGYFIPQAGWFRRVACPHYCFEVVAWIDRKSTRLNSSH